MEMKTLNGYEVVDAKAREEIEKLKQADVDIDLSEYAKKSDIPDVSDFISEIPSEYITETELEQKGYLTEHQSLANYATNESVRESIESVEEKIPSLDGYATQTYVDNAIAGIDTPEASKEVFYIDTRKLTIGKTYSINSELKAIREAYLAGEQIVVYVYVSGAVVLNSGYYPAQISKFADDIQFYACTNYYSSIAYDNKQKFVEIRIGSNYYEYEEHEFDFPTGSSTSGGTSSDLSNYYTKVQVDTKINDAIDAIEIPEAGDVDLSDYYTKSEVDAKVVDNTIRKETFATSSIIKSLSDSNAPTIIFTTAISSITSLDTTSSRGHEVQFKTSSSCTNSVTTGKWIGDDCVDNVFTPQANTNYSVYVYNHTSAGVIRMVMNIGA